MPFNWDDYNHLANATLKELSSQPSLREAIIRSAVSRYYYAVFHHFRQGAVKRGYEPYGNGKDHAGVRMFLEKLRIGSITQGVNRLQFLHECRTYCDYNDAPRDFEAMLTKAQNTACDLLKLKF